MTIPPKRTSLGTAIDRTSRRDAQQAGELMTAAPDAISRAHWRVDRTRSRGSGSSTPKRSARANALRFAAGLALLAVCAPLPTAAQYFPPPLIIVPPPAQDYAAPKPAPRRSADKPKPSVSVPADAPRKGHYEGRTFVPD